MSSFYGTISEEPGSGALVRYRAPGRLGPTEEKTASLADFQAGMAQLAAAADSVVTVNTAITGLTGTVSRFGPLIEIVLTLASTPMTMTDATTAGSHGSVKLLDFSTGAFTILGGTSDLSVVAAANITATADVVTSVGTVATANDNATLTSTEADIFPSFAATLTSSANANVDMARAAAPAVFDGTDTAVAIYLNAAVPDAGSTDDSTLTFTGTITLVLTWNGDH